MADFNKAFLLILANEGGYSNDPDDPGGETYKGIARNIYSKWNGWSTIDAYKRQNNFPSILDKDISLQEDVCQFYELNYWDKIIGDQILNQKIAETIFDFAVNAGITTSVIIVQKALAIEADGVFGQTTLAHLNSADSDLFLATFTIGKIARYIHIVKKRPSSRKYFFGWICRAMGEN